MQTEFCPCKINFNFLLIISAGAVDMYVDDNSNTTSEKSSSQCDMVGPFEAMWRCRFLLY